MLERLARDQNWRPLLVRNSILEHRSRHPRLHPKQAAATAPAEPPDNHFASPQLTRTTQRGVIRLGVRKNPIARKKRTAVWGEEWDASLLAGAFLAEQLGL